MVPLSRQSPRRQGCPLRASSSHFCQDSQAILIDVENLRGKSGFSLTHADVLSSLSTWSHRSRLPGRLTLVMDHGSEATGLWLPDADYAVVFAGRSQKADDVIAQDLVPYFCDLPVVTVVTADHNLIQRCRRASSVTQELHILPPMQLLEDLESIVAETLDEHTKNVDAESSLPPGGSLEGSSAKAEANKQLDYEIKLGGDLLEAEALVRSRLGVNNKRRKKLKQKVRTLREKLARAQAESGTGISMIDRVTDILTHGTQGSFLRSMPTVQQNELLSKWEEVRRSSNRREKTGDRVILAEKLRRELLDKYGLPKEDADDMSTTLPPGRAFVLRRQASMLPEVSPSGNEATLRIIVVSDTHGFEEQLLPNEQDTLPDGDVLLHLGDFAIDRGPVNQYLQKFDVWLSKQPHPIKLVVRGNHDPLRLKLPQSKATFLTRPTSLRIGGYSFFLAPFTSGLKTKSMPRVCDVIVSHVPPKGLLDRCLTGHSAGHNSLRRGAERMNGGPPALWLCGHIHEARGSVRHVFCGNKETLVINAANADSGIASCIDYGPVVVDLQRNKETGGNVRAEIVQMDGQYEHANLLERTPFFVTDRPPDFVLHELLMAVDLGLRTGVSLYNDKGKLVRYEQFQFDSPDALQDAASEMLDQWEVEASNSTHNWAVTRIAIEGGDPLLREAWNQAANGKRALLQVRPEEWRADLLLRKENMDGESAKAASRLIARQIVADYGVNGVLHNGKFQTDMAESILLGLHISRRLGWISRNPPVRRYTNGGVVVPQDS